MRYLLILTLMLSGCHAYRTPVPEGMCLVTVSHSCAFGRIGETYGYGTFDGEYVRMSKELSSIPFTRTVKAKSKTQSAVLDNEKTIDKGDAIAMKVDRWWRGKDATLR